MEKLTDENFEEFRKKQEEYLNSLTPEEKEILKNESDESKRLLEHCREKTDYGFTYAANKIDIQKFLYLREPEIINQKINKNLLMQLAYLSRKNIILRYLLIEAGLRDKRIEQILSSTHIDNKSHFYQVSNNIKKFYDESYFIIPDELILSKLEIDFNLNIYGLYKPEEISRILIKEKIEKILDERCEEIVNRILISFGEEIEGIFKMEKKPLDANTYIKSMKVLLKYFFNENVDHEFNLKNHTYYSSYYISYLNEMYWLNEDNLNKTLNMYLHIPTFLLNLAEGEQQVAKMVSDYSIKINKELEENNKNSEDMINFAKNFRGGKLSKDKVVMYKKVFEKMDLERQNGKNPKWTDIFNWVTKEKDSDGNPLISDEVDRKIMKKSFLNWRGKNNINSLNQFLTYLKKNS